MAGFDVILKKLRKFVRRRRPDGLISLTYLLPVKSTLIGQHMAIWKASRQDSIHPLLWLIFQFVLWLKWVVFYGWINIARVLRQSGEKIERVHGISKSAQFFRLVRYTIGWCIPADEFYRHGMFDRRTTPLLTIFISETWGYHNLRNKHFSGAMDAHALLKDKYAFSQLPAIRQMQIGIDQILVRQANPPTPMPQTLIQEDFHSFFKLRAGSGGRHSFAASKTGKYWQGTQYNGTPINSREEAEKAWGNLISRGDALVQPLLVNHPSLQWSTNANQLITVRAITTREPALKHLQSACLEVPYIHKDSDRLTYVLFPICLNDGSIEMPEVFDCSNESYEMTVKEVFEGLPDCIPDWGKIWKSSIALHQSNFDIWAVAWDWAMTDSGPKLLEGNSGWSMDTPQEFGIRFLTENARFGQ